MNGSLGGARRTTWKRLAGRFAGGLAEKPCETHVAMVSSCPYCRDADAVRLYEAKLAGKSALSWQEVTASLAQRFQHFEECSAHTERDADPSNCPFCRDQDVWLRYVEFCRRRGVKPWRRDVDVITERASVVSLDDLRAPAGPE